MKKALKNILLIILIILAGFFAFQFSLKYFLENRILKKVIERLQAESRIAEVLVTDVKSDEKTGKIFTTIKFLEYDAQGSPLKPRYFTFSGNIIQFQSLVMRFDDIYIKAGDKLKGKSAYLFWKVFMLDGPDTQQYQITKAYQIPEGYRVYRFNNILERSLWNKFWRYALDPEEAKKAGVKNVQIEAPGTVFVPGMLYTLKIEHDGGIRIDVSALPYILKGERIPD